MAARDWTLLLVLALGTAPAWAEPLGPDGAKYDNERLQPGLYPAAPEAETFGDGREVAHPPFHLDYSVGLKGAYTSSSVEGGSFLTTLNPHFTATHDGRRADLVVEGSAEIARPWDGSGVIDFTALRLGLSGTTALDQATRLSGNAALALSHPLATTPGLDPLVIQPPAVTKGSLGFGLDRQLGKVNLGLRGSAERTIYGPTERRDSGLTDNSAQNLWESDASLRAGLQVTPILEVFGEASVGRDMFDMASSGLGVKADATSSALRGGIAGNWNGILSASASIGVGYHDFDAASLADIRTQLYDAQVTYAPDPTTTLTAALSTSIEPTGADANGTARVTHRAGADLGYVVNSWLRLRASADWSLSILEGNGETERRHGVGAGADYALNAHTALSADYGYSQRTNSTSGTLDTHTISLGVTVKR